MNNLCDEELAWVLLFVDHDVDLTTRRMALVNRSLRRALASDGVARALCIETWGVGRDGLRKSQQWPTDLDSWWDLHRLLNVWAPLEGFYSCASAWPWGLLLLLRFEQGCFVGDVIKGGQQGENRVEVSESISIELCI